MRCWRRRCDSWRSAVGARSLSWVRDVVYGILAVLAGLLVWPCFRLSVRGRSNLRGGGVLVARHRSYWDILVLAVACGPARRITFLARRELLRNPFFAPFVWAFATVIDREAFGREDLRRALRAAERAKLLGIFPEGTTRPGAQARTGAIRLAERLDRPLIPVKVVAKGPYPPRFPRFPKVEVRIGTPFVVEELALGLAPSLSRPERYRILTEQLMERIDAVP